MSVTGGEDKFLSHLCGDEVLVSDLTISIQFLSHLCGDEAVCIARFLVQHFLSHLCGDEVSLA